MESLKNKGIFDKISPNVASLIAQYLTLKDLVVLGTVSCHLRTIFYEFSNSWREISKNYNIPESIISQMNTVEDFKELFNKKMVKCDKYYLKFTLTGSWLIFPAHEIYYDWKDTEYWPLHTHKESWFGDVPIPHLVNVCWFRVYGDFVIPKGKYSLNFRICADQNFSLHNSYFTLAKENSQENLIKYYFTNEVEKNLIEKYGQFSILKLGEFDLTNEPEKELKVLLRSQQGDDWWKQGFWLDAIVFIPI